MRLLRLTMVLSTVGLGGCCSTGASWWSLAGPGAGLTALSGDDPASLTALPDGVGGSFEPEGEAVDAWVFDVDEALDKPEPWWMDTAGALRNAESGELRGAPASAAGWAWGWTAVNIDPSQSDGKNHWVAYRGEGADGAQAGPLTIARWIHDLPSGYWADGAVAEEALPDGFQVLDVLSQGSAMVLIGEDGTQLLAVTVDGASVTPLPLSDSPTGLIAATYGEDGALWVLQDTGRYLLTRAGGCEVELGRWDADAETGVQLATLTPGGEAVQAWGFDHEGNALRWDVATDCQNTEHTVGAVEVEGLVEVTGRTWGEAGTFAASFAVSKRSEHAHAVEHCEE
ncbi:MAG: hypothetical protein H6739_09020 [Alphaproteobacteria bacterium]|nr:hypothetical protein [Alphaproteobacteria bacterium]